MSDIILAFPLFSIIVCFVGAVLCSFTNRKVSFIISLVVCSTVIALSSFVFAYTKINNTSFIFTMGHFDPNFDPESSSFLIRICNEIRFGPLEGFLSGFFALVLLLCILGGKAAQDKDINPKKQNLYYVMMCLILVSNIALIYTNDIFTGFVFIEISTLVSCGCLMVKEKGPTILSTIRYMIFNLIGSGAFLLGIVILYNLTGYLAIENIASALQQAVVENNGSLPMPYIVSFTLIVAGLSAKSGLVPFHFWMPDAYGCATSTSSSILSGIVTKSYVILLIKCIFRMFTIEVVTTTPLLDILFFFGVAGMMVGSINAIRQTSIDRMVAFSSAAQIGYIFMGIGLGENYALVAALFHMLTHAITKPLLFISIEHLSEVANDSKKFKNLRGAGRVDIVSGICYSIGALSMVGIPLLAGFMSKYLFLDATLEHDYRLFIKMVAMGAIVISTVLNAIYFARTMVTLYLPLEQNKEKISFKKYKITYLVGILGLACLNVFLGVASGVIVDVLETGVDLFEAAGTFVGQFLGGK